MINFIQASQQLGLKTAAFKHTHHSVAMDVAGTDTARFSEAGADQVGMQQDGGFFGMKYVSLKKSFVSD